MPSSWLWIDDDRLGKGLGADLVGVRRLWQRCDGGP